MVIGILVRPFVREIGRYIYRGLRAQDRLVDYAYRKTGLYNRGVVRGIQHGLISGQVVGGILNLGLPGDIENGIPQKNVRKAPNQQYKTYRRYKYNNRRFNKYNPTGFCRRCRQSCPCKCRRR